MSFSADVKTELCRSLGKKKCCSVAEAYGILLYCHTFSAREIRIVTAHEAFAASLPRLFRRAFGVAFDSLPQESAEGRRSFLISSPDKIAAVFRAFGTEPSEALSLHINLGVLENDCCKKAFVRGAFLAGGSVTDPGKRYHLELATTHRSVARELYSLLLEMGFSPGETARASLAVTYFKQSETIADFLTVMGADVSAMRLMNAKVEKTMRNEINRKVNCDTANADKVVAASQEQLAAIRKIDAATGIANLPEGLSQAALLRIANPEASLSDLALLSDPPVTKSCLSHRLKKLVEIASKE